MVRLIRLLALGALVGLAACDRGDPTPPATVPMAPDAAAIARNNRGVGEMGQFAYGAAVVTFDALVRDYPDWLDARVNLAIATLNRQEEGDEEAALALVDRVLAADPGHLRAHYVAGLLRLYRARPELARDHFQAVATADPGDAYAAYYLGQCLAQLGDHGAAYREYRRALDADPYLRSAYYGAFQAAQRLGEREAAADLMAAYQRLGPNPRARLAEFKYTRMGPRGEALAVDLAVDLAPAPLEVAARSFAPARSLPGTAGRRFPGGASLSVADADGDGRLDLLVSGAAGSHLLLQGEDGEFREAATPFAGVDRVAAAAWGDYDNDGRNDLYLCRDGENRLWRRGEGGWEDVTEVSASDHPGACAGVAFFDADHDGDLDLFVVNRDGPDELLNNNLDGTFLPLAAAPGAGPSRAQGLAGEGASRGLAVSDLDGDRDADILVLGAAPPHRLHRNDRLWRYALETGLPFLGRPARALVSADGDGDGTPELFLVEADGVVVRWRPDPGGWVREPLGGVPGDPGGAGLAVLDGDGDGALDLLAFATGGWRLWALGPAPRPRDEHLDPDGGLRDLRPILLDPARGPGLVALAGDGGLRWWPPGESRPPYLTLRLSGRADGAHATRSNASGIGARVAVRVGSRWTVDEGFLRHSGPGQSLQPLSIGLGGAAAADFVAVDWPDGVYQTELNLAAGAAHGITETQRQLSSCPVLFAWDGERYAFVSDFLGVGGIGYAVGPGEYAPPRPWENLLLPAALLQPRDGGYHLKVSEPMEEVAYLDQVRLVAWDLPPGWDLVPDERMATGGPEPSGAIRLFRREALPRRAVLGDGSEVTAAVLRDDGRAVPVGELDPRFIGRLAGDQVLTLEFAAPLEGPGEPLLVAHGWVEYPYSQTMFAAWQAGAAYRPPTLEGRDGSGRWYLLAREFGYPAGMPRVMSLPLNGLRPGTDALRLTGNMEVYWDRLAVAWAEPLPEARRRELPLVAARQAKTGFPRWSVGAQRRPHYDYQARGPFWDTKYPAGHYTRLGPVTELVAAHDDGVAVIGPGEEVHLQFRDDLPALPAGWSRRFVLETRGWAKDMDLFTRDGETVAPMPSSGRPPAPRDALHGRYLTRYLGGR